MNEREECARKTCRHEKTSHFPEPESSGDITQPGRSGHLLYRACSVRWCECRHYVAKA